MVFVAVPVQLHSFPSCIFSRCFADTAKVAPTIHIASNKLSTFILSHFQDPSYLPLHTVYTLIQEENKQSFFYLHCKSLLEAILFEQEILQHNETLSGDFCIHIALIHI